MTTPTDATEVVLVVEDEESVRRTVREWLQTAELGVTVLAAADAASALELANDHVIDLAILDWNLGAGTNGLDLLEDLHVFQPDLIAIMMTAYADQATPLDAMRKGVRDYLDKNHELTRETFLNAVKGQLKFIRPAKQQRQLHQSLISFRDSLEKTLPLVQSVAALNDPVTLPEAISTLFRFLMNGTRASDGVLFVRHYTKGDQDQETCRIYNASGERVDEALTPFSQSIASSALSMQETCVMTDLAKRGEAGAIALQPFEKQRYSLLAAPLLSEPGLNVVLELFDKQSADSSLDLAGFRGQDVRLVHDASEFGAEIFRQALAQRQTHQVLLDALRAAIHTSESISQKLQVDTETRAAQPPPDAILDQIKQGLNRSETRTMDAEDSVRLAEAIRVLAVRHGPPAVKHCIELVESARKLLDQAAGM